MKAVIISGSSGFIGTHLTNYLSVNGYEVFALIKDRGKKLKIQKAENIHVIEANLNSYEEIVDCLPQKPIAFFHFAWAGVNHNQRTEYVLQMQNVELSINAVKLASAVGAEKFVFPGSTMEYLYYGKPIDKDAVPSPSNAYGVAKIAAKYACSILCKQLNLPFIYAVISSVYSYDRADNNVIYYTIDKLLRGEKPSLTKLEQLWDYIYIDDVVYGLKLIAEKGKPDAFYTIGHGDNWPLANYIYQIRNIINPELPLGVGDLPYSDNKLPCSCVNLETIREDTGFVPKTPFDKGIRIVIDEIRKRFF